MPIIKSLLDTDCYKTTMMQAVLHQFPNTEVRYKFHSRGTQNLYLVKEQVEKEIDALCELTFTQEELNYLASIKYFKKDFIYRLKNFKLDRNAVTVKDDDNKLSIEVKGNWFDTILFEVPILAIVSECWNNFYYPNKSLVNQENILNEKLSLISDYDNDGFWFSDFGTRRRFSFYGQNLVLDRIVREYASRTRNRFSGTSNLYFAKKYNLTPIGTMAHEWLQAGQGLGVRLVDSQKFMLEAWVKEYRGDLGIALTDVIGIDAFLRDFDLYFAKLYDGVRHDSGDPYEWGEKMIEHYKKLKIDPKSKMLVFSDGLNFKSAVEIYNNFKDRAKVSFGIGTSLMNDLYGVEPLKIVMKMVECNGQPVAKISDTPEKGMCEDPQFVSYLKKVFKV